MATLDKDLLNEWLSTMVRVFVGAGMTPADFAAAVVADVGDTTDAAAVLAALDAHIADAANAHAASAIGASGVVAYDGDGNITATGDLTLGELATLTIPSATGSFNGALTIGPGDAGLGADDDFVIGNSNGNIKINVGGGDIMLTAANVIASGVVTSQGIAVPTNNVQATAAPTAAENTAAGYPNGSLWTEVDADKLWVKVSESAGTAVWKSTTLA